MSTKVFLSFCLFFLFSVTSFAAESEFSLHEVKAKKGDGIFSLLRRYKLDKFTCNVNAFYELNKLNASSGLVAGKKLYHTCQNLQVQSKVYKKHDWD